MLSLFKQSNKQVSYFKCSLDCFNSASKFWPRINSQHIEHLTERNQTNHENKHNSLNQNMIQ